MYLEKLEINGFKSFANKSELVFTPGITSVVGPNGSGKSNIADAIRWVLGEQSMKTLRGKRSDDVIFAGTDKKSRLGLAEVSLYLNNEDKSAPVDYSQLVITRRVYRDGHGEYFLNKAPARLQDIVMLLAQMNFGQRSYSVIGQGMVDSVLAMSPTERKTLFDDAAGVRQYQLKKEEAILKLQHTRDNLAQARVLMQEIEPRLRSLTRQIKRLERREEIEKSLFETQRQYYSRQWSEISDHLTEVEQSIDTHDRERQKVSAELKQIQGGLEKIEKEKTTDEAFQQLQREYNKILEEKNRFLEEQAELKSSLELQARHEGASDLVWLTKRRDELDRQSKDLADELKVVSQAHGRLLEQLKVKEKEQSALVSEFESIEQQLVDIRQRLTSDSTIQIDDIKHELDKLDAIHEALTKYVATDDPGILAKVRREIERFAERLQSFRKRVESSTSVADPSEHLELQTRLAALFKNKDNLVNEIASLSVQVEVKADVQKRLQEQLQSIDGERLKLTTQITRSQKTPNSKEEAYQEFLKANEDLRKRLGDIDTRLAAVREKISSHSDVEQQKKQELFGLQKNFRDTQHQLNTLTTQINELQVDLARTETRKEDLERELREAMTAERLDEVIATAQKKEWDRSLHHDDLSTEIARLKHQLELIGGIEEGTADEYHQTNERFEHLSKQSTDLEESIVKLEQIIEELDQTIKKRFDIAFDRINAEFQRFFRTLFNGGQAKLTLIKEVPPQPDAETDADDEEDEEDEDEDDDADDEEDELPAPVKKIAPQEKVITGIDIFATPPGKRLKGIGMLSGGERALTSIALICAIIYNNPSPFIVLDEVDAALDEANSRRLASILTKLVNRTQFITITHNRATMEQSKILYGVTMGSDGVSKLLSMKLEDAEDVIRKAGNR